MLELTNTVVFYFTHSVGTPLWANVLAAFVVVLTLYAVNKLDRSYA